MPDYTETLQFADKIIDLIDPNENGVYSQLDFLRKLGLPAQSAESTYVISALHKLTNDKHLNYDNHGNYSISGTTFIFKQSGKYKGQIERENQIINANSESERIALINAQSVIDTNLSIQALNTKTDTFYTKQRRYNNVQVFLTIALLLSSAIYTTVAVVSYNESKRNSTKEQRLEVLEKKLQDKTTKDSLFQKAVKDSLKMK